ncbi:MAG: DUF4845 domain-containing protein [Oceanospirillaceae bacterium]|jgi:hypothetical protein|uniref:DUF4845 domain-containing protein n=1 Tax=Marinobacterium litorale TaxID=404770 RepID=UPI0003FEBFD0|nr:DUF4845 domain-containing protein [Marinobacterium litorale]MBS98391.1 DUF4845 domain-containing protein [Oceanospirillaceae bacterium]
MSGFGKSQRGASLLSSLLVIIVAGIFFTVGFKLYTPYWDHATIKSVVETAATDDEEIKKQVHDIRRDIDLKLHINQVSLPSKDALKIELKEGVIYFDLVYERRVPMFGNVDAVVNFEEHFEAVKP